MKPSVVPIVVACFTLMACQIENAFGGEQDANEPVQPYLTVRLIDEEGKPIVGAKTGLWVIAGPSNNDPLGSMNFRFGGESDQDGIARFREGESTFRIRMVIHARHAERQLVAVQRFADQDLSKTVDVVLHPECHVHWRIHSAELERANQIVNRFTVMVAQEQALFNMTRVEGDTFHAVLPPGIFKLECDSAKTKPFTKAIEIGAGCRDLDLGTSDLEGAPLVLLSGKPAPELDGICDWKNGPPLTLANLRGKVVLLEFWGWWCGPCVHRGIPEMFKLRDEFAGKDLVVIGIHTPYGETDEIDSVAKLDARIAGFREKVWNGRDIDFPVAICARKTGTYSATSEPTTVSKICFDYGINSFPTTVLIDRDGNIVGSFNASSADDRATLKRLLNVID